MVSQSYNDLKSKLQIILDEQLRTLFGKHSLKFEGCKLETGKLEEVCYFQTN